MKVVILAGGFGTRISEESKLRPKPMVELGGMPILLHIMKLYSAYGFNEFIICAGYKQHVIKEYFADYFLHTSDISYDFSSAGNEITVHKTLAEPWRVTVVDTGLNTMTGGRIKRIESYVGRERFMLTYGDGVGDVNIKELLDYHEKCGKTGTVTVYNFGQSKGVLEVRGGMVDAFREKSDFDGNLINIGFMVLEPEIFDYISGDETSLEKEPISALVEKRELAAYTHRGFWQCMDTAREKEKLERLWNTGKAPWKIWRD